MKFTAYFMQGCCRPRPGALAAALVVSLLAGAPPGAGADPWRVRSAAGLPDWVSVSGSHRTRYETLDGQFRATRNGGDQVIAFRTLLLTELRFEPLRIGVEIIDSRATLDDRGTAISTTVVNPVELLQGYIAWDAHGLLREGDHSTVRAGRLAIDVGSRRLVARSLYRNTINTFTGVEWQWRGSAGERFQAFYTLPVNRKPNTVAALLDDDIEFDEEDGEVRFWGVYYRLPDLSHGHAAELFVLGLDEDDGGGRATRNRELYTPGFRVWRALLASPLR